MTTPTPTRITDWDNPGLPLLLRLFNAVGGWPTRTFVSLEPEDLLSAASKQTGLSDFGDNRFREPLELLLRAGWAGSPHRAMCQSTRRHQQSHPALQRDA